MSAPVPLPPEHYRAVLDPQLLAYIDAVSAWFPPEILDAPIAEQRQVYNAMCRAFDRGRPQEVDAEDETLAGADGRQIPIRIYRRGGHDGPAAVLYLHGGGFVLGDLDSHDDVCAEIVARTGFTLVAVDYRLAPEHLHPAAFDDAAEAFAAVAAAAGRPVVLCGDSAGATLAGCVAHASRAAAARPAGQVLIYPALGGDTAAGSYITHAHAPLLSTEEVGYYRRVRAAATQPADDPTFEPLAAVDYCGLPPTVVVTAACDPLAEDGGLYCARIAAAGGKAAWIHEPGLVHSFLRARATVAGAAQAFDHIAEALRALGEGRWPW
jgi:acetyl esterase